jgi:phosphoribosylformylglycinamidine synthase
MATGAVLGIQDMGAAGLTCSTCEMGARGELGLTIELDLVPQRAEGMTAYEIMLSESQERMLLVADKGREGEVLAVFAKWGLDASIVGIVTADDTMRVTHHGELVAEIPNKALTDDAPVYQRPVGEWKCPAPLDPPAWVVEELKKPRDYTADLKKLLASANICDKRWVFEQYDSMGQTNTVQGPGGEAGVMRIKGCSTLTVDRSPLKTDAAAVERRTENGERTTERGIAMALAGNGRWCWLDPKLGAMHAVAEAARKVACTGATPVAATNCLNFGNPEKPEIMAQLSAAIDGIAEACTALGTPVTGGNVSLYNETKGEGIYPTPVIGIVGLLEDVSKAVPSGFQQADDLVFLWHPYSTDWDEELDRYTYESSFGSSEYAKTIMRVTWGKPPGIDLEYDRRINDALARLASEGLLRSACDVGSGGLAVAVAKQCIASGLGARIESYSGPTPEVFALFLESTRGVLLTCNRESLDRLKLVVHEAKLGGLTYLGRTTALPMLEIQGATNSAISAPIGELVAAYGTTLESQLAAEVVTA